ncbi:MAG: exosortase/archaeosortase family protein [Verrucomicrobiota bacterium]
MKPDRIQVIKAVAASPLCWITAGFFLWLSWICADDWNNNPNYSYGWIITVISIFFLYRRLIETPFERPNVIKYATPVSRALWLAPVTILILELVRMTPIHWRPITWSIFFTGAGVLLGMVYLALGKKGLKALFFPVFFLSLAIPWPSFIEITIIREFSFLLAAIAGEVLLLLGTYAEVQGKVIELSNGSVGVDEACSGLRSLQAALMVGFALGEWFRFPLRWRVFFVVISVLVGFAINIVRTITLSLLVAKGGSAAFDQWHDTVGLISMIGLTLTIAGLGSWITKHLTLALPPQNQQSLWHEHSRWIPKSNFSIALTAASLVAFCIPYFWYHWNEASTSADSPFLGTSSWNEDIRILEPADNISEVLRHDSGGYLKLPPPSGSEIVSYHFFWKPSAHNGKVLFHRPDVCMPGGGWIQNGPAEIITGKLNGRPTTVHKFDFSRGNIRSSLYWFCWIDELPVHFSGRPFSNVQLAFIPEFIRIGKRAFSVELMGVMTQPHLAEKYTIHQVLAIHGKLDFEQDNP